MSNVVVRKKFTFEASHILPNHPGKCSRLHGHSWGLTVSVAGPVNAETGMVVDFYALSRCVKENVIDHLDHTHLGQGYATVDVPKEPGNRHAFTEFGVFRPWLEADFLPTSENLCAAIGRILEPWIKELGQDVRLDEIEINETCTSGAVWRPDAQEGSEPRG